jgi:hypothetical protein
LIAYFLSCAFRGRGNNDVDDKSGPNVPGHAADRKCRREMVPFRENENVDNEVTMPNDSHQRAAELHELAAHAHRTAAAQHEKGDHQSGHEHSRQALEHASKAYQQSQEAHQKSATAGKTQSKKTD